MLPVSYGLLIPSVELGMDGKSFQCILPVGQSQELSSSIGTLKVEKVSQGTFTVCSYNNLHTKVSTMHTCWLRCIQRYMVVNIIQMSSHIIYRSIY